MGDSVTALISTATAAIGSKLRAPGHRRLALVLARLRENLGTLAALGAFDLGGFLVFHRGGFFVLGVSILLADWAMTG